MAGLVVLIVSVAALDSLNPSTIGPALLLAVGRRPAREVVSFIVGVFAVSTLGGIVLLFGPGRGVLAHVARPSARTLHLVEVAGGGALLFGALLLWLLRHRVRRRLATPKQRGGRAAIVLGAGIMAVELPTAFPYLAGLVAIVESRRSAPAEVLLVVLYNTVFVAPLLVVLVLVTIGGSVAARIAGAARAKLDALAPVLAPVVLALVGATLLTIGAGEAWG